MFTFMLAVFVGALSQLCIEQLPLAWQHLLPLLLLLCVGGAVVTLLSSLLCFSKRLPVTILIYLLGFALGFALSIGAASRQLNQRIPASMEGSVEQITGKIASIPQRNQQRAYFLFTPVDLQARPQSPELKLSNIQVAWTNAPEQLGLGDIWSLTLSLRYPHALHNPGVYDQEKSYFAQRVSALANVRPNGTNRQIQPASKFSIARWRQSIFARFNSIVGTAESIGVIQALITGEKSNIPYDYKALFGRMGVSHLIAISGLHIGLAAGWIFFLVRWGWGSISPLARRWAPVYPASVAAFLGALFYSLLAGFSAPTQRALLMVSFMLLASINKRETRSWLIYSYALAGVILIDPFSPLMVGFWLSFLAVAIIIKVVERWPNCPNWQQVLLIQGVISLSMVPIQWLFFQQTSLVSPLVNLIAIPFFSFFIVPVSMCIAILLCTVPILGIWCGTFLAKVIDYFFAALFWLDKWGIAVWENYPIPAWLCVIAFILILCVLIGKKWQLRLLALIAVMALWLLPYQPAKLPLGSFTMIVHDVGQGLAVSIHTQNHNLIFDTGPGLSKGAAIADRVVVPYLKRQQVKQIDTLIISHAHWDHSAGLESIVDNFSPQRILSGEPHKLFNRDEVELCEAGDGWEWDGVSFSILHPSSSVAGDWSDNNASCVLRVSSGDSAVLLTGDIERKAEQTIIEQISAEQLQADILVVPHHGSRTSSTEQFVQWVAPQHAIFPTGYRNRYRHPTASVVKRYLDRDVCIWNNAYDGAVWLTVADSGIDGPYSSRIAQGGIWTMRFPNLREGCL